MTLLMVLSWIFILFIFSGFLYIIFSWIFAKDAVYVFENKKERLFLILRRFLFMVILIGGIAWIIASLDTLPSSSPGELQDYTPGENIPWK